MGAVRQRCRFRQKLTGSQKSVVFHTRFIARLASDWVNLFSNLRNRRSINPGVRISGRLSAVRSIITRCRSSGRLTTEKNLTKLVLKIGVRQIMRIGQLVALLVILAEAQAMLEFSWVDIGDLSENPEGFAVVVTLVVLLVLSEFVRLGRLISIPSLVWLGFIARFTGLGWAGTGFAI